MTTSEMNNDQWQRWKPAPIRQSTAKPEKNHTTTPPANTSNLKEKIRQAEQEAVAAGHEKGYREGHAQGLDEGRSSGHEAGYQEGLKQGLEQGLKQGLEQGQAEGTKATRQAVARLDSLIQTTANALTGIESDMGQALITLAVRIAEKVIHDQINTHPEQLLALIDNIVQMESEHHSTLVLHVNPADLPLIESHISDNPETRLWRAVADDNITRGGCRISTPLGDIDATLETRWKRVVSTLGES